MFHQKKTYLTETIAAVISAAILGANPVMAEDHIINIKNFVFTPESLTIQQGDSVVWTNLDIVPHTATDTDAKWDSGEIKPGDSHKMVFDSPQEVNYFCLYHPSMRGSLEVLE